MTAIASVPTRPVLRYHGGKWRLAPWIIAHLPAHRVYVEPFGGAASVLMRKPRSDFEVYNDLDADVVNVFRVLRDPASGAELRRLLELTPWARLEFNACYEPTPDPVERARRTVVRCFMGHGSTSRRKNRTGFRAGSHPNRRGGGFGDWAGYPEVIEHFVDRLRGVVIECGDGFDLVTRHDGPDALFYVDPPYPISTRSSMIGRGTEGSRAYAHELTDDDHVRLAARLAVCQGAVVVSGYACPLYDDELYAAWDRDEKRAMADQGKERTEVLWVKPAMVTMPAPACHVQAGLFGDQGSKRRPKTPDETPARPGEHPGSEARI